MRRKVLCFIELHIFILITQNYFGSRKKMKMHCNECNIYTMECTRYSNDTMKCKSWLFKSYFDNSCFRKRKEKGCILNITMIIETIYSANEIHAKVFPLCICTDNIISSTLCRTQMRKLEQSTWFTKSTMENEHNYK